MTSVPRLPQRDPTCFPITPAMRAIVTVPPGALWRVSWIMAPAGALAKRHHAFLLTDNSARKWCAAQGIPFPGDQAVAEAARGDSALARQVLSAREPDAGPRATGEAADPFSDVRSRAAGEHHDG